MAPDEKTATLRALLERCLAYVRDPAGLTPEIVNDRPRFDAWVERMRTEKTALTEALEAVLGTPASRWRENGEPDPHGNRYECERAQLAMGDMTDDELANAVFLTPSIPYLTAAKDRIRWLSRHAVKWYDHSVTLNRVLWRMAVALGDVSAEADEHYGDIDSTIDRFFAMAIQPVEMSDAFKAGISPQAAWPFKTASDVRRDAYEDARQLRLHAAGLTYSDTVAEGEAKHRLREIATRIETGYYCTR